MKTSTLRLLALLLLITACNKNDVLTEPIGQAPIIELDSDTGIYTVKAGRELTVAPTYLHADGARYAWTAEGKLLSSEPTLHYTWEQAQELYLELRVETAAGVAREELKVEVLELAPPTISLIVPPKGIKALRDTDYILAPDIRNDDLDDFRIEWLRDGAVVCTERTYTFREAEPGTYPITIRASNCDGETLRSLDIEVVESMPYEVRFPTPSLLQTATDRYTFAGRPLYLRPLLEYFERPSFRWSVDGVPADDADERIFRFTPSAAGEYAVSVTVTEEPGSAPQQLTRNISRAAASAAATVRVICVDTSEQERCRPASAASSGLWNRVYEYTPAPGQFINESSQAVATPQQAVEYAAARLTDKGHVSLGAFGGYIVVGFDHSIVPSGLAYDFAIQGNAVDTSSEPGVVWVMQDTNGNGLPDDEWYELKGSESGAEGTIREYEVTYYRPAAHAPTPWRDSEGHAGCIEPNSYHSQEFYYPSWIPEDSYTLSGTRLAPRNRQDPATGQWSNDPYDWGYADNLGSDSLTGDSEGSGHRNGFRIDRAVHRDGTPVDLLYVDFIKVQCGVLAQSGWLGETSTEVFSFEDLSITGNL